MVADTLSCLSPNTFPDELAAESLSSTMSINTIFSITSNHKILELIKLDYNEDAFCIWVATTAMKGWQKINGLWYIGGQLLVPRVSDLCEMLFHLAHDTLGHFCADKSYASLRSAYYWPNIQRDLEQAYIPLCANCLQNKSRTMRPAGPLHPLLVPDVCGESITMNFISSLPLDNRFDCILSITDHLGSDV